MKTTCKHLGIFLLALLLGTAWGVTVGMLHGQLRAALLAWVGHTLIFWFLLVKFRLFRFAGFFVAPPAALIGFQLVWQLQHPVTTAADNYLSNDRSHYRPNTRFINANVNSTDPGAYGWNEYEILIGKDGFRADPNGGQGNPESCRHVLIGDSMIYGSGLRYSDTLHPLLVKRGIDACVFGVPGNSPADYLSTLNYVADRIAPNARVAFYLYAYNDFVDMKTFLTRRVRDVAGHFHALYEVLDSYDNWRRNAFTFVRLHTKEPAPRVTAALWEYDLNDHQQIKIHYPSDPRNYRVPGFLSADERRALQLFFTAVADKAKERAWQVSMVIHPDDAEIYANLARREKVFADLDPRRAEALALCQAMGFHCADISGLIYARTMAEGQNAYFTDDRHFSRFGMSIVADHFAEAFR